MLNIFLSSFGFLSCALVIGFDIPFHVSLWLVEQNHINMWHIKLLTGMQSSSDTVFCGSRCAVSSNATTEQILYCCSHSTSPWSMEEIINESTLLHLTPQERLILLYYPLDELMVVSALVLWAKYRPKSKICGKAESIIIIVPWSPCGLLHNSVQLQKPWNKCEF